MNGVWCDCCPHPGQCQRRTDKLLVLCANRSTDRSELFLITYEKSLYVNKIIV